MLLVFLYCWLIVALFFDIVAVANIEVLLAAPLFSLQKAKSRFRALRRAHNLLFRAFSIHLFGGKPITVAYYQRINYNVTCGRAQTSNNIAGSWFGCCCRPIPFAPSGRTTAAVSLSVPLCVDSVGGCVRSLERLWRQHCECIVAVGCNNKLNWGHRRLPLLSAGGRLRFYYGVVCMCVLVCAGAGRSAPSNECFSERQ